MDDMQRDVNGRLKRMDIVFVCRLCRNKKLSREFRSKLLMRQHIIKKHFAEIVTEQVTQLSKHNPKEGRW